MDFKGKNVLITGASRGIGKATALAFAKKGAKVGLNYRSNDEVAKQTLAELPGEGHQLFKRDISQKQETRSLIEDFVNHYGQLDVLVNNAGISIFHEIDQVDFDHWIHAWEKTFETNLFAVANLCRSKNTATTNTSATCLWVERTRTRCCRRSRKGKGARRAARATLRHRLRRPVRDSFPCTLPFPCPRRPPPMSLTASG